MEAHKPGRGSVVELRRAMMWFIRALQVLDAHFFASLC